MNIETDMTGQAQEPIDEGKLRERIDALMSGSIEPDEFQQLQDQLKSEPAAREVYLSELEIESLLKGEQTDLQPPIFPSLPQTELSQGPSASSGQWLRNLCLLAWFFMAAGALLWSSGIIPTSEFTADAVDGGSPLSELNPLSDGCQWYVEDTRRVKDVKSCRVGDVIRVTKGQLAVSYPTGTRVVLQSPAAYQLISATSAKMIVGRLTATVSEAGAGFTVITPQADVIDLGTEFGVGVENDGATDVVVFKGEVDVDYHDRDSETQVQRLRMGEAVRLDAVGTTSRLNWVNGDAYSNQPLKQPIRPPLISEVRDNIERGSSMLNFYEIVPEGMAEDALAYVDRIAHQYNGVTQAGLPSYLISADYVKMFNSDKYNKTTRLKVTISSPAKLYILLDNRVTPPEWLTSEFRDTGDDVGLDTGPFQSTQSAGSETVGTGWHNKGPSGVGPGVSIDDEMSVWVKEVARPGVVELGPMATTVEVGANMYGILATPLDAP